MRHIRYLIAEVNGIQDPSFFERQSIGMVEFSSALCGIFLFLIFGTGKDGAGRYFVKGPTKK